MAAVEKQLEAAQRFLRGVRSLPSYEDIQTKQLKGLLHCLDKVKDLSTAQAGIFLDALDASFSLSPDGLEEVIQAMRGTIPAEPHDGFARKWAKVSSILADARAVATVAERRVLARLAALLQVGEWHATALDLPPHPKLLGLCLVTATDCPRGLSMGISPFRWPLVPRGPHRSSESAQHTCVAFLHARK